MTDVQLPYENREAAGRALAEAMTNYQGRDDLMVLGLPRGGVPVAAVVAEAIGAPVDVIIVRKLGLPRHEELAMGAIASGGVRILNDDVVRQSGVSDDEIDSVAEREHRELRRREQAYRGDRDDLRVEGRCVILVDDGIATGSTMRAALRAVRQLGAKTVVVAVPVAPPQAVEQMRSEADDVICPATPNRFMAIGQFYSRFDQTTDDEVREVLASAWEHEGAAS